MGWRTRARGGVFLLEILVGVFLFLIAFGAIGAVEIALERAVRKQRHHNVARFLMQQEMERVLSYHFADLPTYAAIASDPTNNHVIVNRKVDGKVSPKVYTRKVTATPNSEGDILYIKVSVTYDDDGTPRELSDVSAVYWTH